MRTEKIILLSGLLAAVLLGLGFRFWAGSESPLPNETLTDLVAHPLDPSNTLVASERELYVRNGAQGWKRVLALQGRATRIKKLLHEPLNPSKVYCLTEKEVLLADLKSGRIERLFREGDPAKNRLFDLALSPVNANHIYLGTEKGLFVSKDGGHTWKSRARWPENQAVTFLGFLPFRPATLLLGTSRELFFSRDAGESYESGFSLSFLAWKDAEDEDSTEMEGPFSPRFSSFAYASREDARRIWVGTAEGVFESHDEGASWTQLPESGLEDRHILDLVSSDRSGELFAATRRGIFHFSFQEKRWERIPLGLVHPPTSLSIQSLPGGKEEKLLVAAGHEVFEWTLEPGPSPASGPLFIPSPERVELYQKLISLEPPVREIRKRAIRYGQLGNGKITRWHWASRLRAFIPDLSFKKDFSLSENIDIDRGGTSDPDRFIRGPEEADRGWDFGLTWNLGDFLYSSNQTSIDNRAKLLVELRESILSQVTRLYYERRKIQMEIFLSGPPATPQEHWDRLLRLDELTSLIDALTDGFLSERLEATYQNHPELNRLFSLPGGLPDEDSQEKQET